MVGFGACVLRCRDDVLPDDDDRQENELKEVRGEPVDEYGRRPLLDRSRQRHQCDEREDIGAVHRSDDPRDSDGDGRVEPAHRTCAVHARQDVLGLNQPRHVSARVLDHVAPPLIELWTADARDSSAGAAGIAKGGSSYDAVGDPTSLNFRRPRHVPVTWLGTLWYWPQSSLWPHALLSERRYRRPLPPRRHPR